MMFQGPSKVPYQEVCSRGKQPAGEAQVGSLGGSTGRELPKVRWRQAVWGWSVSQRLVSSGS